MGLSVTLSIANLTGGNSIPYHAIPSIIAVNMILAVASGGVLSVLIASWAQVSTVECQYIIGLV